MFDLGYKQIIINSSAVVTEDVGTTGDNTKVVVEGFGTFYTQAAGSVGTVTSGAAAVLGAYSYTAPSSPALAVGQVWTVTAKVHSSRKLAEVFAYNFDTLVYQSAPLASADAAGFYGAMAAGQVVVWPDNNDLLVWDGAALDVDFAVGYEGYDLLELSFQQGTGEPTVQKIGSGITEDTAPSEGIGTGKQLEAEVRNATFDNIDPYGIQFGGNTAVDVRALYTTIAFETSQDSEVEDASDMTTGWEDHAMSGSNGVNTSNSVNGQNRKYIAYVNEASGAAAITILTKLTTNTATTA